MRQHHTFNRALANILLKTAEHFSPYEPFRLREFLTHNEINNFQKLAYFGLAQKYCNTKGEHVAGKWNLTGRAMRLILGSEKVESWVETFMNKVQLTSTEMMGIADTIGSYMIPQEYAKAQRVAFPAEDAQNTFDFNAGGA
jgi:hypothetical protein